MSVHTLLSQGWPALMLVVWIGLCVGSFLNVVVYRLPVMLERSWREDARHALELDLELDPEPTPEPFNLMVPRSRCPACATPIRSVQNIPVISWLLLRGRCAGCGTSISMRYPSVELATAAATLVVVGVFGFTWTAGYVLLASWMLIVAALIDFDTQLLPDSLTLPLLWLGLLANLQGHIVGLESAVIGAIAGYLVLWFVYWGFKLLTGKEGMGYGDFKLLAALGAWVGWQALPMVILISSVVGIILGGSVMLAKRSRDPIPFGPFLAIAGWVCLLWRDSVVSILG